MYVDFTTCAMDQIVNQVAKLRYMSGGVLNAPMVIRTQGGAGTGQAAQHSQSLEAWFMHAAGLKVVMPATPYDAKGLFKAAIRDDDPVMFLEHKLLYFTSGEVPEEEYVIDLGIADVKREGDDVTIIATSRMVLFALEAAEELEKEGISCEVVDPRTLVPLDTEAILNSVAKTHHVVAVDEGCKRAGATSELAALIQEEAFDLLDAPIRRVAAMNTPVPYAPTIEARMLPGKDDIVAAVKSIVG
jgi:pyruvate/2-oxoglutarate/acetoin dehydrogenase E1 component